MGSRRTTARSSFGSGRSSSGEETRGNSRPNGCSYISNVRPENRSTLCSMMAQLTEETQPSFELTLKSKAVSENSNVKFSCVVTGNPTPQITWYKDDVQLDRYCGLPKYEIFRNGKNYSLHIYNCTVEDAAIYQTSASNTKGIVSCSGVLEVGEMNEYKIHQRYFAKVKQKADIKSKETEGKENQEPLRTISPDRTLRKRRSTMEAFLSTPSSMEEEGNEESKQAITEQTEARLQEATVKEMEEKSVPITNGTVSAATKGQTISENGNKSGSFTAQQPKIPFVRKKIKISNTEPEEQAPEERTTKQENISPVVLACTESVQFKGNSDELMEVENIVSPSVVDSVPRKMTQRHQKSEEVLLAERPSKNESVHVEVAVPSKKEQLCLQKKEQLTASVPPAAPTSTSHNMSETKGKKDAKLEKEAGRKNPEKILEMQKQIPPIDSKQRQSSPKAPPRKHRNVLKGNMSKIDNQSVMDVDKKSNTSSAGSLAHKEVEAINALCESTSASPQRPCEQAGDKLSPKETGPCQKNMSVPQPAQLNEVKQVHTKRNRNDAPVIFELPQNRMDVPQPQKTPSERKTTTDDIQTPSMHCGVQAAIGKMTQDTWDHSRGSNESHTVLFTDGQKSPFQSPGGGENTPGCNVSSSVEQSQADTAIKTVEGTEIQVDEKVKLNEAGKLLAQSDSMPPNEKIEEMETESPSPHITEHTGTEKPKELASGARRKILMPKTKSEEASEATAPVDIQTQKKEGPAESNRLSVSPVTLSTSPSMSRRSPLLRLPGEQTPPAERRSPLVSRRKMVSETPAPSQPPTEEIHTQKTDGKPAEKDKHDPFKAPQVIRKIRGESFADASGHLKLWCQFFNILGDSTIKWYKNEEGIAQIKRNAGDETQVNLAIVQASCIDSGVYGCTITNEYGTDTTDFLLSADVLAGMSLREDLGVGEEIEMTPMIFSKGVADSGSWGNKFFGRIMMQESRIGKGCSHKVWRAKVIYGLEPVFESGNTCIIKGLNPIAYGGKAESCLIDRNLDIVKQECKIQNLAREYCKIFSAEARVIENFGPLLEVLPVYLMYRPANTVPYAKVEADLTGVYQKYSVLDDAGRLDTKSGSEAGQKCCALQHWIFQWTSGHLLISRIEGVDTKITNVGISIKSTGHHGLSVEGNPKVFEQFVSQHQCNYFCGLLSLRSLKIMDSLLTPTKPKGSKSPLLQRKLAGGSNSPQTGRKAAGSPRLPRKTEQDGRNTPTKQKAADPPKAVKVEE
ncbi:hypothetical protein PBY51_018749 [Eleginops maclovinus]|uniref:non-specific serine/threonine protein kinase n=1 Tax=Eleginops maclovinus TaxID=56733 RepID=A0AAN7YEU6_ELEMC|nr:hypothetical protein PBY51_018749 [Eleginops maclovinus]